jgi:hypothetical protein
MKLSWNSLKISIAGARLSHLVTKDKIWDHGSMVEQVRTVFIYFKKALLQNDPSIIKKCTTLNGYKKIERDASKKWNFINNSELVSVEIIGVIPARNHSDKFKALVRFRNADNLNLSEPVSFYRSNRMSEQEWLFVREGNWWLLDEIKK